MLDHTNARAGWRVYTDRLTDRQVAMLSRGEADPTTFSAEELIALARDFLDENDFQYMCSRMRDSSEISQTVAVNQSDWWHPDDTYGETFRELVLRSVEVGRVRLEVKVAEYLDGTFPRDPWVEAAVTDDDGGTQQLTPADARALCSVLAESASLAEEVAGRGHPARPGN